MKTKSNLVSNIPAAEWLEQLYGNQGYTVI